MRSLQQRFPKATDGILFCLFKLQQNPECSIRDFRDEANLHGISIGGRAFHSAKVLLGIEKPAVRRTNAEMEAWSPAPSQKQRAAPPQRSYATPASHSTSSHSSSGHSSSGHPHVLSGSEVEASLIQAVQGIQEAATADARRLRSAIVEAIEVLQRALDGRSPRAQ